MQFQILTKIWNLYVSDFFDAAPSLAFPVNGEQSSTEQKKPVEAPVNSVDALPEGFFDDPVQDAKVSNSENCELNQTYVIKICF